MPCDINGFRDRPIRPLWHLAVEEYSGGGGGREGAGRGRRGAGRPRGARPRGGGEGGGGGPERLQLGVGGGVGELLAAVAAAAQLGAVGGDHDGADRHVAVVDGGGGLFQGGPHPAFGGGGVDHPPTMTGGEDAAPYGDGGQCNHPG